MTRTRAWTISIIATVSLLALVLGIGASTGQFGFEQGGTTVGAQTVANGDGYVNEAQAPTAFDEDEDERERYEDEDEDDDEGEHEDDDHEGEYEGHEEEDDD